MPGWNIYQNPYNFVRFSKKIVEKDKSGKPLPLPDHSIFSNNSGYIECTLTNETPLFIGGRIKDKKAKHKEIEFFRLSNKLAIPSTSLKGMLRSFIEALTGSCLRTIDKGTLSYRNQKLKSRLFYEKSIGDILKKDISPNHCTEETPCLACRLFGYVSQEIGSNYAGRISISHAFIVEDFHFTLKENFIMKPLGQPNPTSVNLYLIDKDDPKIVRDYNSAEIERHGRSFAPSEEKGGNVHLRGRKFYWHKDEDEDKILHNAYFDKKEKFNSTIEALNPNARFTFKVYFNNLTDFELGLLLYALKLEDNMRHKLGMAKSLGFGSVKINIEKLFIDDMQKKYSNFTLDYREDKAEKIDDYIQGFKLMIPNFDQLPSVEDLRYILNPDKAPKNICYPEEPDGKNYKWYMNNKDKPLPTLLM